MQYCQKFPLFLQFFLPLLSCSICKNLELSTARIFPFTTNTCKSMIPFSMKCVEIPFSLQHSFFSLRHCKDSSLHCVDHFRQLVDVATHLMPLMINLVIFNDIHG